MNLLATADKSCQACHGVGWFIVTNGEDYAKESCDCVVITYTKESE